MEKFSSIYGVRGSEIAPDYRLRDFYIGFYFQESFAEYMASKKMAAYDMANLGLTWLISDARAEILGELPFWRNKVKVDVWACETTPLFLQLNFRAYYDNLEFACGAFNMLVADARTHKPIRISKFAAEYPIFNDRAFEGDTFSKFEVSGEKIDNTTQCVRAADLDFNNHLNNVRYLPRAIASIPSEKLSTLKLNSYRMKFLKEAKLGDEILSETFSDNSNGAGEFTHRLTRLSDNAVLCLAKTIWL